jgi:hypothetical protein
MQCFIRFIGCRVGARKHPLTLVAATRGKHVCLFPVGFTLQNETGMTNALFGPPASRPKEGFSMYLLPHTSWVDWCCVCMDEQARRPTQGCCVVDIHI